MSGFGKMDLSTVPPPPGSPEYRINKAFDVLKARGVLNDRCPRCRTSSWNVDLIEVPATSAFSPPGHSVNRNAWGAAFYAGNVVNSNLSPPSSGILSMLSIVCNNCGYTMFHNLNVLGV